MLQAPMMEFVSIQAHNQSKPLILIIEEIVGCIAIPFKKMMFLVYICTPIVEIKFRDWISKFNKRQVVLIVICSLVMLCKRNVEHLKETK
jgi:hypothetical protein